MTDAPGFADRIEAMAVNRDYLVRVAYRMLGSIEEAEDVVQEALVRAGRAQSADIVEPLAWLTKIVTNVALDHLKSARVRRESYVGPWLPEPDVGSEWNSARQVDPADRVTLDDQISLALMTVLESLSPAERAVYVLHEAFSLPLADVAEIVGRSRQACRQLAVRARAHVREQSPRFTAGRDEQERVVGAFQSACESGDFEQLAELLDTAVVFRSDGGGVVSAAVRPISGRKPVVNTLRSALRSSPDLTLRRREVNGQPGLVAHFGANTAVLAFVIDAGRITHIDVVANPNKLRHVPPRD
jgi:RNA polymerase sigma-70 factor (ECF subfamily)